MINPEALKAELDRLTIRRKNLVSKLDERISIIQTLIALQAEDPSEMPAPGTEKKVEAPFVGMTAADAIKSFVEHNPQCTDEEIIDGLIKGGIKFASDTSTDPRRRIRNEIYRLRNINRIVRQNGRYSLPAPA